MNVQGSLDTRIAALVPEVDETLRHELQAALVTLRRAENPLGVILTMSRMGLLLMDKLVATVGESRPSSNLYNCILRASNGSEDGKIHGLHLLPRTMAENLDIGRAWDNQFGHALPDVPPPKLEDAENALRLFLRVLEWFYCEYQGNECRLESIYSVTYKPVTLEERFAEVQQVSDARARTIQTEIERLQEQMRQASERAQHVSRNPIPIPLPALHGTFMDRIGERDTLHHLLRRTDVRMVVIVAPGGYGKTELTSKVLRDIVPITEIAVPDVHGVLYLRCLRGDLSLGRAFSEAGRIVGEPERFRQIYGQPELTLERKCESFLAELSSVGNVWIIFDNFEDLLAPDDTIADEELRVFFEMAATTVHRVRLIATTRAIPRFRGSQSIKVIDVREGLPEPEAVEYLRIEGAESGLADADESLLREFVRRVHGIPKALESVLGYLSDRFPVVTLAQLMSDSVLFGDFDRYDTDNGLKRLVAEQFNDQTEEAKLTLCALSVFPKATPLAALNSLLPSLDLTIVLRRLERNRLVSRQGDRYELHPLVQEHAYRQIPDVPTEPAPTNGSKADKGDGTDFTRRSLHIRAAEFCKRLQSRSGEWKTFADVEPHLDEFAHRIRAEQFDVARRILDAIAATLMNWGHYRLYIELASRLDGHLGDGVNQRAYLRRLGTCHRVLGDYGKAVESFEALVASARAEESRHGMALGLEQLGVTHVDLRDLYRARECFLEALGLYRELEKQVDEVDVLLALADIDLELGQVEQAHQQTEQCLDRYRELNATSHMANAVTSLGIIRAWLGRFDEAIVMFGAILQKETKEGFKLNQGISWSIIGSCYLIMGRINEAIQHYERALAFATEIGFRQGISHRFLGLARAYHTAGKLVEAQRNYRAALTHADPETELDARILLGVLLLEEGSTTEGHRLIDEGRVIAEKFIDCCPSLWKESYYVALARLAGGRPREALGAYRRALDLCSAKGVVMDALNDMRLVARVPNIHGVDEARTLLEEAALRDVRPVGGEDGDPGWRDGPLPRTTS